LFCRISDILFRSDISDENNKPINAGNRFSKDEFVNILGTSIMEEDENTTGFTFVGGKFVERKR
jgi:hypothetical protein